MAKPAEKALAKELFLQTSMSQKAIAERVGVTENTMSKWCALWEGEKKLREQGQEQIVQSMMREVIEINEAIKAKPAGERYADARTADARNKIIAGIQRLQRSLALGQYVTVMEEFIDHLAEIDLDLAKRINPVSTQFLKLKSAQHEGSE